MDRKRLKNDALAKTKELIDDHPFESFKIGSLAMTRQFIGHHPFQSNCGSSASVPSSLGRLISLDDTSRPQSLKIGSLAMTRKFISDHPLQSNSGSSSSTNMASPSGIPMRVVDQSRRHRTVDEVEEQTEASRQHHIFTQSAGDHRRRAAFTSIEQYWDYNHPCGHCGRVWLRGSSVGLRKKCCQGGRMWHSTCPFILKPMPQV